MAYCVWVVFICIIYICFFFFFIHYSYSQRIVAKNKTQLKIDNVFAPVWVFILNKATAATVFMNIMNPMTGNATSLFFFFFFFIVL